MLIGCTVKPQNSSGELTRCTVEIKSKVFLSYFLLVSFGLELVLAAWMDLFSELLIRLFHFHNFAD